jgi:hypothetical protein
MHFSKISAIILTVLAAGGAAAPYAEADSETVQAVREEVAPGQPEYPEEHPAVSKRGFGCPFNRYQCNDHVCYIMALYHFPWPRANIERSARAWAADARVATVADPGGSDTRKFTLLS